MWNTPKMSHNNNLSTAAVVTARKDCVPSVRNFLGRWCFMRRACDHLNSVAKTMRVSGLCFLYLWCDPCIEHDGKKD